MVRNREGGGTVGEGSVKKKQVESGESMVYKRIHFGDNWQREFKYPNKRVTSLL